MSIQQEQQATPEKRFSTRSVLLIVLAIGLASSAIAYGLGSALAENTQQATSANSYPQFGPRPLGGYPGRWAPHDGTSFGFLAVSRVNNVTVTGFNIASANQFTVNLSYSGGGTAPAITIVGMAYQLSGSNTMLAGWGTSTTVTVNMVGSGSLSSARRVAVLIVPYTA